ncbi:hypothetical protein RI054_22g95310 [Pseudoscourfieldia marina]
MSSPANSLLSRIANAVASPFYTRTRNARTAANNEANPGTNPGTPPTTPPPEDEHQSTASPPSTPHQTPTLDPLEQLRAAMTLLMQQQHNQNAMLQRQRQQQHEQQQQLITVLNKLDVTSIPTTDEEPPNDSSSAAAQISSLMTRVPRVIVPDHLVTDFTTDITKDVDTFLLQMDEALTRAAKPGGGLRFCVDFRALNRVTRREHFPIPSIDDLLEDLGTSSVFSAIDLYASYHQLRLKQPELTSFVTPSGQYEYVVVPFGLVNAPSAFSRFIHNALKDVNDVANP